MTIIPLLIALSQAILSAVYLATGEPGMGLALTVGACGWLLVWRHERRRFSNEPPF